MRESRVTDRRGFLRLMAALGLSPVLAACARALDVSPAPTRGAIEPSPSPEATATVTPAPTPQPSATLKPSPSPAPSPSPSAMEEAAVKEDRMGQVALIRTDERVSGVRRALNVLNAEAPAGGAVVVKPNYNSADATPGSTHEDVLRTLMEWLIEGSSGSIRLAERSGMGDTRAVLEQRGVFAMGRELGFEVEVLDELEADAWELVQPQGSHWREGFPFPTQLVRGSDYVVQTCCLKTHRYGGHFTLSLKNSVGLVAKRVPGQGTNYMGELHGSPHQRLMIAEINAAYATDLVVLDGVEAFVDGGPARGTQVQANVILAGRDRVALDAVGVAILRHFGTTAQVSQGSVFEQEQIRRAVELGLGVAGPDEIEILTDDDESAAFGEDVLRIVRT